MDHVETTVPPFLFMGLCVIMTKCCHSTILALGEHATIYTAEIFVNIVVYLFMFYLIMLSVAEIIVLNDMMINKSTNQMGHPWWWQEGFLKAVNS
jgi:hypothetical protein